MKIQCPLQAPAEPNATRSWAQFPMFSQSPMVFQTKRGAGFLPLLGALCLTVHFGAARAQDTTLEAAAPEGPSGSPIASAVPVPGSAESNPGQAILGPWLTQRKRAIVTIKQCDADDDASNDEASNGGATDDEAAAGEASETAPGTPRYCGNLTWTWNDSPLTGSQILAGFSWDGEEWTGGRVFDPKNQASYGGRISMDAQDQLSVRACLWFFCRTQAWTRPETDHEAMIQNTGP